ncbi:MAG: C4-dicarboxylate ABC transporter, partial [Rhodocyclaceae bacterium]|nr:C4-dicarboxylate ABC transporter [Rhodocyclaceae bacterium]
AKLHTVGQKYLTLWGYVADPLIFVVNKNVWNSWSEADRKAVADAAQQAAAEELARARAGISASDDTLLKQIEANGVTVVHLTDAERNAFRKATAGVYKEWAGKIGEGLVKQAEEDIAKR